MSHCCSCIRSARYEGKESNQRRTSTPSVPISTGCGDHLWMGSLTSAPMKRSKLRDRGGPGKDTAGDRGLACGK